MDDFKHTDPLDRAIKMTVFGALFGLALFALAGCGNLTVRYAHVLPDGTVLRTDGNSVSASKDDSKIVFELPVK